MRNKTALKLSKEELFDVYGIELHEDGTVFDPIENRKFKSLVAWLDFAEEQEDDDHCSFEKKGGSRYYDDEY